jgi:xylulose-5-phosphate/fructose-6-phosphate phosphoketolase
VLPILHLNGYKIANPTVLARIGEPELVALLTGYGWDPVIVSGDDPVGMHHAFARALDRCLDEIKAIQDAARRDGVTARPRWPMIVLRSPKGWTGPRTVDGLPTEGSWRSHQVPFSDPRGNPEHLAMLETWLRSYRPEELFDETGAPVPLVRSLSPSGARRMSANPPANGGELMHDLRMPDFRDYAVPVERPGTGSVEATRVLGTFLRDVMARNLDQRNFRVFAPDENSSNRLDAVMEVTPRA